MSPPRLARSLPLGGALLGLLLAGGCRREQAPAVRPPPSLRVEVEVDGQPAAPIDAARLLAVAPAGSAGEGGAAWRLQELVGEALAHGATLEVEGEEDTRRVALVRLRPGEVRFVLNRRGEALIALDGEEGFHGRGGNRGRGGDGRGRIRGVRALRIWSAAAEGRLP